MQSNAASFYALSYYKDVRCLLSDFLQVQVKKLSVLKVYENHKSLEWHEDG